MRRIEQPLRILEGRFTSQNSPSPVCLFVYCSSPVHFRSLSPLVGDLGRVDSEGLLYITGRIKDLLITAGGENVPPTPIEDEVRGTLCSALLGIC